MLYKGADLTRDVEFVIFDEVHYVNDAEVGYRLYHCRTPILIRPGLSSGAGYGKKSLSCYPIMSISSYFRPRCRTHKSSPAGSGKSCRDRSYSGPLHNLLCAQTHEEKGHLCHFHGQAPRATGTLLVRGPRATQGGRRGPPFHRHWVRTLPDYQIDRMSDRASGTMRPNRHCAGNKIRNVRRQDSRLFSAWERKQVRLSGVPEVASVEAPLPEVPRPPEEVHHGHSRSRTSIFTCISLGPSARKIFSLS